MLVASDEEDLEEEAENEYPLADLGAFARRRPGVDLTACGTRLAVYGAGRLTVRMIGRRISGGILRYLQISRCESRPKIRFSLEQRLIPQPKH